MTKITSDYIVGYVDGRGSFSIIKSHNHQYPKFAITSKDTLLIRYIQNFFNIGKISTIKPKKRSHDTIYVFIVVKYDEIKIIVDFFTNNSPIENKQKFERFKECFLNWKPKFIKREREESIKALNEALDMYKEGVPIKDIVSKTSIDLKKLYIILRTHDIRRYNKSNPTSSK